MTLAQAQQIIRLKGHTIGTGFARKEIKRINWYATRNHIEDCSYVNAEQLKTAASMLMKDIEFRDIIAYLKQNQG